MKYSVQSLLDDIHVLNLKNYEIVEAVRALALQRYADLTEEVKYGGILFSSGVQFAGVFSYRAHVSLEFIHGAKIVDPYGLLEGKGKGRRHIKLYSVADIHDKKLAEYLLLAWQATEQSD